MLPLPSSTMPPEICARSFSVSSAGVHTCSPLVSLFNFSVITVSLMSVARNWALARLSLAHPGIADRDADHDQNKATETAHDDATATSCVHYTGSKARIGGRLPLKRSTSTVVNWPVHPCAKEEVPRSRVSTFGLP